MANTAIASRTRLFQDIPAHFCLQPTTFCVSVFELVYLVPFAHEVLFQDTVQGVLPGVLPGL